MITATEALEIATTKKMNVVEQRFFDLLCIYTDFHLKNHFDGEKALINLNGAEVKTEQPIGDGDISGVMMTQYGKYGNAATGIGRMPWWRQRIVITNWLAAYRDLSWQITTLETMEEGDYGQYEFRPDIRDIKLNNLGIK